MEPYALYGLYGGIALGAVALYMAMPRAVPTLRMPGMILAVAALVGLLFHLGRYFAGEADRELYFLIFSGLALIGAFRLISHPKPIYSALYFILVILAVVALLILLEAEFLAIALAIIYAGAILVTYLFVIMLAQQARPPDYDIRSRMPLDAVAAGFLMIAAITSQIGTLPSLASQARDTRPDTVIRIPSQASADAPVGTPSDRPKPADPGNTERLGALLFTRYMMAMQLAGVLLLVAMVGAIALACKQLPPGRIGPEAGRTTALGQIGRTVPPF